MTWRKLFFFTALSLLPSTQGKAQLVINELMQSNVDCIMDELNEFPDSWVELYNSSDEKNINISFYKLGVTTVEKEAWKLPNVTLAPHEHALIYCDKVGSGNHTNFRLESAKGGAVYLFLNGKITDQVTDLKKQPAPNIAYGRKTDGAEEWGYQLTPTPGYANTGETCDNKQILGEPVFSTPGVVSTTLQPITISLSLPSKSPKGTEIRYTLDGSEPTTASPLYDHPLTIDTTTVIRAKLFCQGWLSPRSTTQSYVFFPRKLTLPVISLVMNDEYLNDEKIGIYVQGTYEEGVANFKFDWRRPLNFEYFEQENSNSKLNQLCETRITGAATRTHPIKSLAIYANKRFGAKRLEYEFFPDQRPGVTEFKSLILRNAGNDFDYLFMRDAIIQRTMASHVDLDWQAWRPAIVYINGKYRGMLNIRERSNEDNIYTNYNKLEDIDMVENNYELKAGDLTNFNAFTAFYNEHNHTMAEYEKWMDCSEYMNLMIMNLYYNNQDFPGNNIVMWRPRTKDGRWRWIAKDTDFGIGLYGSAADYNTIKWLYTPNYDEYRAWANKSEHTRLFRRLMEDATFSREFIDRCAVYMGDFLNERGTRDMWDSMYDMIREEYPHHRALVNPWWPNYNDELTFARNWLSQRTDAFYQQLADYYQLGTPVPMRVNTTLTNDELETSQFTINDIALSEKRFNGKFFANRQITLQGQVSDGKMITGWNIVKNNTDGSITSWVKDGASYTFNMPECKSLTVSAIISNATGINTLQPHHESGIQVYNLQGMLLGLLNNKQEINQLPASWGKTLILRQGDTVKKIVR